MGLWKKVAIFVVVTFFMGVSLGPVSGQEPKKLLPPEPEETPQEVKEPPPQKPAEPPGYFPGLIPPSSLGTTEEGPVSGFLAPYGNTTAYDSLLRGWNSRKIGKMTVTPFLELAGLYRSNIFSTPTDKKSDFITIIAPGIRMERPVGQRHLFSLGYLGGAFIYSKYSSQSHYDQNLNADLAINPKGKLSMRLGDTFRLATEERNSEFAVERTYLRNTPYLMATYRLADRWKLEGNYQLDTLVFTKSADRFNNYNEHIASATLYYKLMPKTAILAQYIFFYRVFPYVAEDNAFGSSPLLGVTWDPTAKLTGTIKAGFTFTNYETSVDGRNNNPQNWTLSAQLLYRYSKYTNLSVTGQRSFQQDIDFFNAGYINSGVWITLNHEWNKFKVASYVSFFYTNNDYLSPSPDATGQFLTRHDDIVGIGVGMSRPLKKWLRARLAYSYVNRDSNFIGYGYNDHKVLGGLQASF
ncbi:MAG: outer membrane beta-barrel protein [Desulfobaccales bacterium]